MSNSEAAKAETFEVKLNLFRIGLTVDDVRVTVYNGLDEIVHRGPGPVKLLLPKGLYTIRAEYAGEFEEQVVHHTRPTEIDIRPKRHAAAPLSGTASSHEYYSNPSRQISLEETSDSLGNIQNGAGRLFVFIRMTDEQAYHSQDLADGLSLRRPQTGKVFTTFDTGVRLDGAKGYLAYSAKAEPGMYVLEYAGQPARQMTIYIYKEWQTQVFVIYHNRPLLEGTTLLLARAGAGFDPDDRFAYAIDMAINGLQNDAELLPQQVMWELLNGKFDNPMLGVLGVHLLLRRTDVNEGAVSAVLDNLDYLLPGSTDVRALRVMAALRFNRPIPGNVVFETPPMIRAAFQAIVAADNLHPHLVPEGGWLEAIAPQLYTDSPWTSWAPLPGQVDLNYISSFLETAPYLNRFSAPWIGDVKRGAAEEAGSDDWVRASLREVLQRSRTTDRPMNEVMAKFAADFNVPLRLVKRAYSELKKSGDGNPAIAASDC